MTLYGGDDILEKTPKALSIKIIIDNLNFIKIKSVCFTKGYYQENEEMGHRMGENSFKNISDKKLLYKTCKELNNKKMRNLTKDLSKHFIKEDKQMENKCVKRYTIPYIIIVMK